MQQTKLPICKDEATEKSKSNINCSLRSLCSQQTSSVIRCLSHGLNSAERGPLATVGGQLAIAQKKT